MNAAHWSALFDVVGFLLVYLAGIFLLGVVLGMDSTLDPLTLSVFSVIVFAWIVLGGCLYFSTRFLLRELRAWSAPRPVLRAVIRGAGRPQGACDRRPSSGADRGPAPREGCPTEPLPKVA